MTLTSPSWPLLLESILQGNDLQTHEAAFLMQAWLAEDLSPVQTGAFLAALRAKGVNGAEMASMANVLRDACSLPCPIPEIPMVDTCGTGGDGADTFNISTAVAFTASSCGVNVAKHGNRSASGKVGSADVLEALGLELKAPLKVVVEAIHSSNVTFLFAPAWHSSLINLAPLRKNLGVRTVFNLLGPLVNPLRPQSQVLGVASPDLLDPMSEALLKLGLKRAVVVHGAGGLDEASLEGSNQIRFVDNGDIKASSLSSTDLGLTTASIDLLKGGDLSTNKAILTAVLKGEGSNEQRDVVALNAALVLWAAGYEEDLRSGVAKALNSLELGLPWQSLVNLREALLTNIQ